MIAADASALVEAPVGKGGSAEPLSCPLITSDARIVRGNGVRCQIEVFA
ncbi:hypothetical protein GCM10010466_04380 [Planomonospora alba]|uniref:Uncharacterized protein n=1 Tax=Planomonospora alba TaxID=161354 RepID=A0ABP6MKX6_9ACTN